MKKGVFLSVVLCALIGCGVVSGVFANMAVEGDAPGMMVSPHMIVLEKVVSVTVHTNIPLSIVVPGTVTLDGVAPLGACWADDYGHLVARFSVAELALEPGEATLTLRGTYVGDEGETFAAEDDVRVK